MADHQAVYELPPSTELEYRPPTPVTLFGTNDPTAALQRMTEIAKELVGVIRQRQLAVVLVAHEDVGEAARAVALRIQAVVLTPWPDEPYAIHRSNMETIERFGEVPVIGLPRTDPAGLAAAGSVLPVSDWLSP